jgi:hypothetical protein
VGRETIEWREMKRNEPGTGLKVHSAQKVVRENEEKMNKGETASVQSKERKHPHFAQFEIKTY